jgi:branched-chain amino acid transport system ATP-binding protein
MGQCLLKVDDLSAAYGGIKALNNVSIEIEEGKIVSVLGSNGAGKTTLLKCICAAMKPTNGTITFKGNPLPNKPHEVVKAGLTHAPEGRKILANLTVLDNLMAGAYLRNDKAGVKKDLEYVFTLFPRLEERQKQFGGHLSGGEQQMLAISRALMAKPSLVMLDEPSLGLAPIIVSQIFDIIKEL